MIVQGVAPALVLGLSVAVMPAYVLPAAAADPAPLAAAVVTDPPHGETVGVVGGGRGLSGPASAAAISGLAVDGAPDGTLLVAIKAPGHVPDPALLGPVLTTFYTNAQLRF